MTIQDIIFYRLYNQKLLESKCKTPAEVVDWLGAVQSQDYFGAKWAVGQRMNKASENDLDKAFTDGSILRTHVMRPTWHFVLPSDIGFMLTLTAGRVKGLMGHYNDRLEITDEVFKKSNAIIAKALQGKKYLTRSELADNLERNKIVARGQRLAHIVMNAELDRIVCSGPLRGKQFTYALFEERIPKIKSLSKDEALAALTKRYFISHGPAQIKDFAWWSGLTTVDAKKGLEMNRSELMQEVVEGKTYWFSKMVPSVRNITNTVFLLSNYDEFGIAYKDRSAFYNPALNTSAGSKGALPYPHMIVINGLIRGMWKRSISKNSIVVETKPFNKFSREEENALAEAAERLGAFHNTGVILQ